MTVSMPPAAVLYRLAKQAKDRAKNTADPSMSNHLNHVGNQYLIANEGREIK